MADFQREWYGRGLPDRQKLDNSLQLRDPEVPNLLHLQKPDVLLANLRQVQPWSVYRDDSLF